MFIKCPCGQKFYTSTAELEFIGEDILYVCPKCGGYIQKKIANKFEVVVE